MAFCRVHWPQGLVVPSEGVVQLVGHQLSSHPVQEWLVTGTATATAPVADRIGVAFGQGVPSDAADNELRIILQPTASWKAASLPIPLPICTARSGEEPTGKQEQLGWKSAQVVLYDHVPPLQQPIVDAGLRPTRGRMQLAARIGARLCCLLAALWLLRHRQQLASAAGSGGSQLAGFVTAQLMWFKSAQPAGVKLHRQTAELLSLVGLRYTGAVQALLSGWAPLLTSCAAGLWAAACVGGGPRHGLLALECLLWGASLLAALPYAALAALYRGQLHGTALMWRSMRGKQRLPLLRLRLHRMLRGAAAGSVGSEPASPGSQRNAGPDAGITGLKQLSGSMLLFMPLLLLLPTTAWFYAAALALHTACSLPRAAVHFALQLLAAPSCDRSSSRSSSKQEAPPDYRYRVLAPRFEAAACSDAAQQAVRCTTFLQAYQCRGTSWKAAAQAMAQAWSRCCFMTLPGTCFAALSGHPVWLAWPLVCRSFWTGDVAQWQGRHPLSAVDCSADCCHKLRLNLRQL